MDLLKFEEHSRVGETLPCTFADLDYFGVFDYWSRD
jgi:hypothetical protein